MNPNLGENQYGPEPIPVVEGGEASDSRVVEKAATGSPESKPQALSAAASSQAAQAIAQPSQTVATNMATDDSAAVQPLVINASDNDRIEKEWVDKAKKVIEQTKDDPYEQKKEMSKVKADYVRKRFNKSLKVDDAVAK